MNEALVDVSPIEKPGGRTRRVAVLYKSLPQYRRRFFELLRDRLAKEDVELVLIYGQPGAAEQAKRDTVDVSWARRVRNRPLRLFGRDLLWQPALGLLRGMDLIIVEQASKLLVNYVLQTRYLLGGTRFAYWGHGRNFQHQSASRAGEAIKRHLATRVHWWFAYNDASASVVEALGFPSERITRVQNAIDTQDLVRARSMVEPRQIEDMRRALGIVGNNVCVYAGGMYREKRLPFLLEACTRIRDAVPDFEVVFLGDGVDAQLIRSAAQQHSWIKYVGPKFDRDKVSYFAMSRLLLMPGLVGLGVLDSFALETPIVTTAITYHSPEIEYLRDGENGVVVQSWDSAEAYATAVTALLRDEATIANLRSGCRRQQSVYTVENMVERFARGVILSLSC